MFTARLVRPLLTSLRYSETSYRVRYLTTRPPTSERPPPQSDSSADKAPKESDPHEVPKLVPEQQSPEITAPPSPASLSLDFAPEELGHEEMQRTGARSSKDSLSSIEKRRRFFLRSFLTASGLGLLFATFYLGREWEADELKSMITKPEDAPSTHWGRIKSRFRSTFSYFLDPPSTELLPPSVPPFQKPYTLLLSIDDLLVSSTWDRQHGWRTAKRPGVDYFLAYLAQFYEVVIFTSQNHYTAIPIIEKLDPYNFFILYKLFRESTRTVNGATVKDLSYLNRDLSKVIIVDTDPEHVSLQPENAIVPPKWNGDPSDKGLVGMIPFLEAIAIYKPQDVRPVLKAYQGKNIPIEYAKKEAEAKRQFLEEWRKSGKSKSKGGGFTLSRLFGWSLPSQDESPEPLTHLELKRKEAQENYQREQAWLATNKAEIEKLIDEDKKAAAAQMQGSLWSLMSGVGAAPQQQQATSTSPPTSQEPGKGLGAIMPMKS